MITEEAHMASVRKIHGRTTLVAGQRNPAGPKMRVCPKCDAKPGHSCGRWIKFNERYSDDGPHAHWSTLKTFHRER